MFFFHFKKASNQPNIHNTCTFNHEKAAIENLRIQKKNLIKSTTGHKQTKKSLTVTWFYMHILAFCIT